MNTNQPSIAAEESRSWFRSLSPEKKVAIRRLNNIRPIWNLVIVMYVAMWAATGALMLTYSAWPVRVIGYVVIGLAIHGLFNIMHEGIHGNLFRNQRLDRALAFLAGIPALSSAAAYRIGHLQHHRYNRTEKDPNEIRNVTSNRRLLSVVFYLALLAGLQTMILLSPILSLVQYSGRARRLVVAEYGLLFSVYAVLVWLMFRHGVATQVLNLWLIPLLVAAMMGNVRAWAEHMLTTPGHPLTQSRTVTCNRVVSFLLTNSNYHLEHHLFPGVPWYNLPRVHRLLQDEYRAVGTFNYDSYPRFLWDALRFGVYGLAPGRVNPSGQS